MNLIFYYACDLAVRQALEAAFARRHPAQNTAGFLLDPEEPITITNYRLRNLNAPYEAVIYVLSRLENNDLIRFTLARNLARQLSLPMLVLSPFSVMARNPESECFRGLVGAVEELVTRHYTFSQAPFGDPEALAASCRDLVSKLDSGWFGRFEWLPGERSFSGCGRLYTQGLH